MFSALRKLNPFALSPQDVEPSAPVWWNATQNEFTPDINDLWKKPFHRVFVCDEAMKPHKFHGYLGQGNIETKVWAFTEDSFTMVHKKLGVASYAIPLMARYSHTPFQPIKGELWGISTQNLIELDKRKRNGVEFSRVRLSLCIPHTENEPYVRYTDYGPFYDNREIRRLDYVSAFMYVGMNFHWEPILTNENGVKTTFRREKGRFVKVISNRAFEPVKTFTPKNPLLENYYYYRSIDLSNSGTPYTV